VWCVFVCGCSAIRGLSNYLVMANSRCVPQRSGVTRCRPIDQHCLVLIALLCILHPPRNDRDSKDKKLQEAMAAKQAPAADDGPQQAEYREL